MENQHLISIMTEWMEYGFHSAIPNRNIKMKNVLMPFSIFNGQFNLQYRT